MKCIRTILLLLLLSCPLNIKDRIAAADINPKVVASINGAAITNEDLEFYQVVNRIQININREADQKRLQGKELEESMAFRDQQERAATDRNTLLTQMIRLRAAALLAKEKGHTASDIEVKKEIAAVKQVYGGSPSAPAMIKEYGEERFWKKEKLHCQSLVLAKKVQQDVLNKVQRDHPKAVQKEIQFLAGKAYEELLISQMDSLKISFVKE